MNKKEVFIPKLNSALMELCGIITGDGHLSRCVSSSNSRKNNYCISIFCNKSEEIDYIQHISFLFSKLFNVKLKLKIEDDAAKLYTHSKDILEFLENLGIIVGKKIR